jgi:DNA-directed RNA polymerase specialized sigma24 family protein
MNERNQVVEKFLPVIESQVDIMVAVYHGLKNVRDDLVSESVIKAFRLIDQYLQKNSAFDGQFSNTLRNVCRQVTWDYLRKEFVRRPNLEPIRVDHPDYHIFPDPFHTAENDILNACSSNKEVTIVSRRAEGATLQTIADELDISRTQVINRLEKIFNRYKWAQIERNHGRFTVEEAS